MKDFFAKHNQNILGVLSGFDRLIFRGCIRPLMYEVGMAAYLNLRGVLLKEFKDCAIHFSSELKTATERYAKDSGRPFLYLQGAGESKEQKARELADKDRIKEGLICVFSALEPCYSYKVVGNRAEQKLQIKSYKTKCLHLYQYWQDPRFGLMHGRIQSWYPYNVQFYLNGKEWLKNQMIQKGLSYKKSDNCFTWISDMAAANRLAQNQLRHDWPQTLGSFIKTLNPLHEELFPMGYDYYWTLAQSEWATDILFKDEQSLSAIYPDLLHHWMTTFQAKDVMRFLGKKLTLAEHINGKFKGEVISNIKQRPEGVRVKHAVKTNSVKVYNKAGSVLRVETTINKPNEFKSYRPQQSTGELLWQPMRKSIYDIKRRAEVSQKVNERQVEALASAQVGEKFSAIIDAVVSPIKKADLRIRGLSPFAKDKDLLDVISNGAFQLNGFRNRDVRESLLKSATGDDVKKNSAKVSRMLRMLRHHGVIKKIPKTHRYMLTQKGIELISAVKTINNTLVRDLLKLAA